LSKNGPLQQQPAPQLTRLRGKPLKWRNLSVSEQGNVLDLPKTNTLEILARIELQTAKNVSLELASASKNAEPLTLRFDASELSVMDAKAPLDLPKSNSKLNLRIFIDRSVLEVFANETACLTKRINPPASDAALRLRAEQGQAKAESVEVWPMKTIW
jgi:beta-fructofuranosidase